MMPEECGACGGVGYDARSESRAACGWCGGSGELATDGDDVDGEEIERCDARDIVRGLGGKL